MSLTTLGRLLDEYAEYPQPFDNSYLASITMPEDDRTLAVLALMQLTNEHSYTPVYDDWDLFYNTVDGVLGRNTYKYKKLYETMVLSYDPIVNYDMTEKETTDEDTTDGGNETLTQNTSGQDTSAQGGGTTTTYGKTESGSGTENSKRTTFDDTSSYRPVQEDSNSGSYTTSGSDTVSSDITDTTTYGKKTTQTDERSLVGTRDITRILSRKGNIGVTTSQQMIKQEREIALFDLVSTIVSDVVKAVAVDIYPLYV